MARYAISASVFVKMSFRLLAKSRNVTLPPLTILSKRSPHASPMSSNAR